MLSSLASLLPSALHLNPNVDLPRQSVNPEETNKEDQEDAYGVRTIQPPTIADQDQQNEVKGKEKEAKTPTETFIFVRPPPSKTNHPLNLQVQLVPPNTKPPGGVTTNDGDATAPSSANSGNSNFTTDGAPLTRTSSSRSSVSYTSTAYGSSTTSFSSFSSSTSNARRTIIPLYNLQAHNVMTNVIVDAGTDAKIAKFQKRGIELIDLALLEPVEIWGEGGREKDAKRESMRIVADETGASVMVNAGGGKGAGGNLSPKALTTFLQPGGSRPVTPSATSSATSLHSQIALANSNANNLAIQSPMPQHLSSQTTGIHQHYPTPPRSNITPAASAPIYVSHSQSSTSSNNPTPMPPASPVSMTSMSLAMMSPPNSPVPGTTPGKRNLFNKLFNKKQSSSNLLSPGPASPGSFRPQYSRSQAPPIITTTGHNQPDSEISPAPTFSSFAWSPAPTAAGADRSFGSRSNSMKKRSAVPPALIEPPPFSSFTPNSGLASAVVDVDSLASPVEQQTTPTQMSVAAGGRTKTFITVSTPNSGVVESPREREKGHGKNISLTSITSPFRSTLKSRLSSVVGGGSQSNSQAHAGGSNVDDSPITPLNKKDRDASPHPSLGSRDRCQSRSSLVGTMDTNDSVDSHGGGGGFTGNGNWCFGTGGNGGGNGQVPQQISMTQAQAQAEVIMNLRQQHLQLRPPVLDIQPTFVSSNPSSAWNPNLFPPDVQTTTENPDRVFGHRALMYVWLVRRWMKKRPSTHGGLSGLGDSAVGFLGGVVGGLKSEKDKEKGKEKEKVKGKDKRRSSSGDYRDKAGGHDGLGAVTAPLMYGGVEVRFEWKRAKSGKEKSGSRRKKSRNRRGKSETMGGGGAESDGEVETIIRDRTKEREGDDRDGRGLVRGTGGGGPMPKTKERLKSEEKRKFRMSTGSLSSITVNSESGESGTKKKPDTMTNQYDGEDSDPEDSETPWVCTLKLRKGATPAAAGGGLLSPAGAQTQFPVLQTHVVRIKVGTLSPTPHHPKVVAMLKVPFPLPDIEVDRMGVVKRLGILPPLNSNANQDSTPYNGLTLTAEEIKDVVCSTGLWLVVREGFGGVGRVSRKGDGWRIRP